MIRVNEQITAEWVTLIGKDGTLYQAISLGGALRMAREAGMDLVEINPKATPPVCKILDYSKYTHEAKVAARRGERDKRLAEAERLLGECLGGEEPGLYALGKMAADEEEPAVHHRMIVEAAADIERRVREWLKGATK